MKIFAPKGCAQLHRRLQGPRRHLPGSAGHGVASPASFSPAAAPSTSATQAAKEGVWDLRRAGLEKVKDGPDQSRRSQQRHDRVTQDVVTHGSAQQPQPSRRSSATSPSPGKARDKRGNRVKGKSLAPDEPALRAELRRQGIAPSRIRKQTQASARAARSTPATSRSSAASSPPCWPPAFRWCRRSRSSATATTSRRCRS